MFGRSRDHARTGRVTIGATHIASCAAILILLCTGCASAPVAPAVVDNGQSLWRHVDTDHFTVEGNLPTDGQVLRIASEFETLWHAFASVPILGLRPPKQKPLVVVLRGTNEYRYVAGEKSAAFFIEDTVLGPMIVLPSNTGVFRSTVIKHELAHFVASGALKNAPQWLNEGLARVMETASYDTQKGKILFGKFSPGVVDDSSFRVPAREFMWPWPTGQWAGEQRRYYGRSWLLVHYLIDEELQSFLNFLAHVRSGENWQSAWDSEILVRIDEIDDALDRYHARALYGLWSVDAELPDMSALQVSMVPTADAFALRCVLYAYSSNPSRTQAENQQAANADLQAASELDPVCTRVRVISAALEKAAHK